MTTTDKIYAFIFLNVQAHISWQQGINVKASEQNFLHHRELLFRDLPVVVYRSPMLFRDLIWETELGEARSDGHDKNLTSIDLRTMFHRWLEIFMQNQLNMAHNLYNKKIAGNRESGLSKSKKRLHSKSEKKKA